MMAEFLHVLTAADRGVEAETVDVEIEWAGRRPFPTTSPTDGALR